MTEINLFLPDKKDFYAFQRDLKTKRAIERNIEIIGEAVNRIIKAYPEIPITNARKIIDTRNRIIHGYDSVSEDIIWAIVVRELGNLETEVDKLLKK
ncbi:HepT-like ribonuclease domain-containing protein [Schleiferia thermophila]|uniref:HepT-like ribonuclease domain-containing protein n=1 Tax=Schleiferia thermophila TaxID=884107 RepID=UPI0027D8B0DA|nr:HepT-like ribonuclease domain-containing protein [Schleiferia thermophila]